MRNLKNIYILKKKMIRYHFHYRCWKYVEGYRLRRIGWPGLNGSLLLMKKGLKWYVYRHKLMAGLWLFSNDIYYLFLDFLNLEWCHVFEYLYDYNIIWAYFHIVFYLYYMFFILNFYFILSNLNEQFIFVDLINLIKI